MLLAGASSAFTQISEWAARKIRSPPTSSYFDTLAAPDLQILHQETDMPSGANTSPRTLKADLCQCYGHIVCDNSTEVSKYSSVDEMVNLTVPVDEQHNGAGSQKDNRVKNVASSIKYDTLMARNSLIPWSADGHENTELYHRVYRDVQHKVHTKSTKWITAHTHIKEVFSQIQEVINNILERHTKLEALSLIKAVFTALIEGFRIMSPPPRWDLYPLGSTLSTSVDASVGMLQKVVQVLLDNDHLDLCHIEETLSWVSDLQRLFDDRQDCFAHAHAILKDITCVLVDQKTELELNEAKDRLKEVYYKSSDYPAFDGIQLGDSALYEIIELIELIDQALALAKTCEPDLQLIVVVTDLCYKVKEMLRVHVGPDALSVANVRRCKQLFDE